ncbi:MAG: 2,3-bisphosphoglycerate-independent phosphoglycerate mutase [Thaumarchaeota archaeon]|nr:2,3-bisphosphoglycerate-independent phosphoglycerate mutase [Nitrososphaerota archaeon]
MNNKLVYILLDGVGDKPDPTLNYVTPLHAAKTPALDKLARNGKSGLVYTVKKGIAPESDIGVFCMLGYDFTENYIGRGVVEAIGSGLKFQDGYIALRGNFATLGEKNEIVDRRAGRNLTTEEAKELSRAISERVSLSHDAEIQFISTVGHRCVLVVSVKGEKLSANISNTDPAYERVHGIGAAVTGDKKFSLAECKALDKNPESRFAAELINEFTEKAKKVLAEHPVNAKRKKEGKKLANIVLLRDAGDSLVEIPSMREKYGLNFACLLDMPVEKGIAKLTKMEQYAGGSTTDYEYKAKMTADILKNHDAVYVHIKTTDEPGHDGDARLKTKVIEQIDAKFLAPLIRSVDLKRTAFVISADHSTPCIMKGHSDDPVPLLVSLEGMDRDGTCRFTEKDASKGSLGTLKGINALKTAIELIS